MFPMTALQSWAFIALLVLTVLALLWLIAETGLSVRRSRLAAEDHADGVVDIVDGPSQPESWPAAVYDWAEQGL